jgi:hypothetical protein
MKELLHYLLTEFYYIARARVQVPNRTIPILARSSRHLTKFIRLSSSVDDCGGLGVGYCLRLG